VACSWHLSGDDHDQDPFTRHRNFEHRSKKAKRVWPKRVHPFWQTIEKWKMLNFKKSCSLRVCEHLATLDYQNIVGHENTFY
jgi:hypothetical protein